MLSTADLCDAHPDDTSVLELPLLSYGELDAFAGPIRTVKCHEDNTHVRGLLEQDGNGAVLVVDGGGSRRCALVGDALAGLAVDNGWAGIIVFGCIRDSDAVDELEVGVKAIGTSPRKSVKRGEGRIDIPVTFGGVTFAPGEYVTADSDGVVVTTRQLN
ncbi:MAG: ribonuclease E activity regulator RraA [Acidimicrobiia bacterium]|jgi:regulator of ribonuclease activity A|nr:MAG: ribonuclease E activity regulator RraA [Acidimicrobiia bacterium]